MNKRFVTGKEKKVMEKISYYVTILEEFIKKKKQIGKTESELVNWVKTNQKTIKEMDSYQDSETQTEKEGGSVKNLRNSLQDNSPTDDLSLRLLLVPF